MISTFRLPDLVLGVSIRADTTGARQAAQQLKAAVSSQFGAVAGGGTGSGFGTGLGAGIGAGIGTGLSRSIGRGRLAAALNPKPRLLLPEPSLQMKQIAAAAGFSPSRGAAKTVAAELKAATESASKTAKGVAGAGGWWAALGASFARGGIMRGIAMAARRFWPLLIVLVAWEFVKHVMIPAIRSAIGYIRASGAKGAFGEVGRQASYVPVLLRNVAVQFGLMWIEMLNLLPVLEDFNAILIRMASLANFAREQKWLGTAARVSMGLNPYVAWFKGINWLVQKLPLGGGGADLGSAGRSPKLAGAYLEGSVEAYSAIRGSMQRYAADTARNTKETSETLKKILARAPEMGVVAG